MTDLDTKPTCETCMIWSNEHRAWWRPNSAGYTINEADAGSYSWDEAIKICRSARDGWRRGSVPPEIPVREADVDAVLAEHQPTSTAQDDDGWTGYRPPAPANWSGIMTNPHPSWNAFREAYSRIERQSDRRQGHSVSERDLNMASGLEMALNELERSFMHVYVRTDDGDSCAVCSLDLWHPIHKGPPND